MGSKGGTSNFSERPLSKNELSLIDSQTAYNKMLGNTAQQADQRSSDANQIWMDNYLPVEIGNTDQNTGLLAATIGGNDSNQVATNSYLAGSKANADTFNTGNLLINQEYANRAGDLSRAYGQQALDAGIGSSQAIQGYANEYNGFMGDINSKLGAADQDVLGRIRAQNLSGMSTAHDTASRSLQSQLAQRGLVNSGAGVKSMGDLNNSYMQNLYGAQANAYGQAVNQSDQNRMNQVNVNGQRLQGMMGASASAGQALSGGIDKNFNSQLTGLNSGYNAYGNALQTAYNTNVAQQGSALNAIASQNQQRVSNLTNYSQLGRGMAGISSNYLGQAGQMYGQAAGNAGNMFGNVAGANNAYNQINNQGNQANSAAKGASAGGLGSLAGSLGSAAIMASDKRLKDNITKIGTVGELNLYTWTWNKEAKRIEANYAPAIGVIAQEVQALYPDAVVEQANGYLAVDYNKVIAYAKGSK